MPTYRYLDNDDAQAHEVTCERYERDSHLLHVVYFIAVSSLDGLGPPWPLGYGARPDGTLCIVAPGDIEELDSSA